MGDRRATPELVTGVRTKFAPENNVSRYSTIDIQTLTISRRDAIRMRQRRGIITRGIVRRSLGDGGIRSSWAVLDRFYGNSIRHGIVFVVRMGCMRVRLRWCTVALRVI